MTGLPSASSTEAGVGGGLGVLVRQPVAADEQELGAGEPDAVAGGQQRRVGRGRIVDIDHGRDRLAAAQGGRPARASRRRRPRSARGTRRRSIGRAGAAVGRQDQRTLGGIQDGLAVGAATAPRPVTSGTPRARASIATWLVRLPSSKAAPPSCVQSSPRKREGAEIAGQQDGALGKDGRRPCCRAGQVAQHAIAQIGQIGGPGAKILVLAFGVGGDLRVERRPARPRRPRRRRRSAAERLLDQRRIGQQLGLELQHLGGHRVVGGGECRQLRLRPAPWPASRSRRSAAGLPAAAAARSRAWRRAAAAGRSPIPARPARPAGARSAILVEIPLDQRPQRLDGGGRVGTLGREIEVRAGAQLQRP